MNKSHSVRSAVFGMILPCFMILSALSRGVLAEDSYHTNNPAGSSIADFPAAGSNETKMKNNYGTIGKLYANGTVDANSGEITESAGSVSINYGTVKKLLSGTVTTNAGTVELINNTGYVTLNAESGVVIQNLTTVGRNYGTVRENYGKVTMLSGTVELNGPGGTVVFDGYAAGSVEKNAGTVTVNGTPVLKPIVIDVNTGSVTVKSGALTVGSNAGTITLGSGARLICTDNTGIITTEDGASSFTASCANNYGTVTFDTDSTGSAAVGRDYVKIVFSGDGGKASVTRCEQTHENIHYTANGSRLAFTLPEGYVCTNEGAEDTGGTWQIITKCGAGDKLFTVYCHKCPAGTKYTHDGQTHTRVCSECGRTQNAAAHSFGAFTSDGNASILTDGTKTRVCSVCGYRETVIDEGSHQYVLPAGACVVTAGYDEDGRMEWCTVQRSENEEESGVIHIALPSKTAHDIRLFILSDTLRPLELPIAVPQT